MYGDRFDDLCMLAVFARSLWDRYGAHHPVLFWYDVTSLSDLVTALGELRIKHVSIDRYDGFMRKRRTR